MRSCKKKLSGKAVISVLLSCGIITSTAAVGSVSASADEVDPQQLAQDTIQGSAVLHCFDWSYNAIKENMADIAAAGYTAVQTSPVQTPKDYSPTYLKGANEWWKLYQPITISVSDGDTWLGTKQELKEMCEEADKYGIKVIVDIVANHMANAGTDGGTYANINANIEEDMKNPDYFHDEARGADDGDRWLVTHGNIGEPDLNSGNEYVQNKFKALLSECIDLGVDGFRFDAAKHIETPGDYYGTASNFWPAVINSAKEKKSDLFIYGEILGGCGGDLSITNYTQYMAVTDNYTGDKFLKAASDGNSTDLGNSYYYKGTTAAQSVLWAESHDTYMGNAGSAGIKNTSGVSEEVIARTWAIVGSRANSTSLFFARPSDTIGEASENESWKSTEVVEINKFKNFFDGTNEYLASDSVANVAYNERGTGGVVIVSANGQSKQVSLTAHTMADGTYTDHITGNQFTVTNGVISGTIGSSGIAVVYNTEEEPYVPEDEAESDIEYSLFGWINGANYACEDDGANLGEYRFKNGWQTVRFSQDSYVAVKTVSDKENKSYDWYMTEGYPGDAATQTVLKKTGSLTSPNKLKIPANTTCYLHLVDNGNDSFTLSYTTEEPQLQPKIVGRTATLGSDIGLNYYIELGNVSPENAQVNFKWDKGEETVDLSTAKYDMRGGLKATNHVAAKEMSDIVTVSLIVNGETVDTGADSVANYLNNIISDPDTYGSNSVTLSKATLKYGAEAQKLFGYKTNALADSGVTGYTPAEINTSKLRDFKTANADFEEHGLTTDGASLRLESETMLRLYFKKTANAPSSFPALTNGKTTYEAHVSGSDVWYDITGFSAGTITKSRKLWFTDSADGKYFLVNVGAYTKAALASNDSSDDQLKDTLKALYGYDTAAASY